MKQLAWSIVLLLGLAGSAFGQGQNFPGGGGGLSFVAALSATCTPGVTASVQLSVSPYLIYNCTATNTWTVASQPPNTTISGSGITFPGTVTATSFITSGAGSAYTQWSTAALPTSASGTVLCGANSGNIFSCSDSTGAVTPLPFLTGDLGGTQSSPQVNGLHLTAEGYTGNQALTFTCANDVVTGTTNNLLAKQTSTGCIKAATTDTNVPVYVVASGGATSGSAHAAYGGVGQCVMDATASSTEGFYVIASVTTAGRCHAQSAQPSGVYIVGILNDNSTTSGSNGNVQVGGPYSVSQGVAKVATSGQIGFYGYFVTHSIDTGTDASTSVGFTANQVHVYQFVMSYTETINNLAAFVVAGQAASHIDVGLYDSTCSNLLVHFGAQSSTVNSTLVSAAATSSYTITPGVYFLAVTSDNAGVTIGARGASNFDRSVPIAGIFGNAANASSGGALPSSCGVVTNAALAVGQVLFYP